MRGVSLGYRFFEFFSLAVTLVMPPRAFSYAVGMGRVDCESCAVSWVNRFPVHRSFWPTNRFLLKMGISVAANLLGA